MSSIFAAVSRLWRPVGRMRPDRSFSTTLLIGAICSTLLCRPSAAAASQPEDLPLVSAAGNTVTTLTEPITEESSPGINAYLTGLRLNREGAADSALFHLQCAVDLLPGLFPARIELGRLLLSGWDLAGARMQANQAITIEPLRPEGYHLHGDIDLQQRQPAAALDWYRTALALLPEQNASGLLHNKTAYCYQLLGNPELAVRYHLKAHQLTGGCLAIEVVDSILAQRSTYAPVEAIDLYEEFDTASLNSYSTAVEIFLEESFLIEMENRNFLAALHTARKLILIDSTQTNYQLYAVQSLSSLERLAEARALIDSLPPLPQVELEKARLYVRGDSLESALQSYREAYRFLPQTVDLSLEIGELYLHVGRRDSALVYFRYACREGDLPACEQMRMIEEVLALEREKQGEKATPDHNTPEE